MHLWKCSRFSSTKCYVKYQICNEMYNAHKLCSCQDSFCILQPVFKIIVKTQHFTSVTSVWCCCLTFIWIRCHVMWQMLTHGEGWWGPSLHNTINTSLHTYMLLFMAVPQCTCNTKCITFVKLSNVVFM